MSPILLISSAFLLIIFGCNCTVGMPDHLAKFDVAMSITPKKENQTLDDVAKDDIPSDTRRQLRIRDGKEQLPQKSALRIRGGFQVDTNENFPYVAAIIINGRLWCAGTIVDENWILTAAHCLNYVLHVSPMNSLGRFVKVRVGSHKSIPDGSEHEVFGAVRHPKFEEEPVPHADVALLKLRENLELSKFVNVIKLYGQSKEPYENSYLLISGFGVDNGKDRHMEGETKYLKSARMKVKEKAYCTAAYQMVNGFQYTSEFFCAASKNGTRDACVYDAGAPAVMRNRLMGIMSFGPERCGDTYMPAVFIKTFFFRDFVRNVIQAYKTTSDLIEAMKEVNSDIEPEMVHVVSESPVAEGLQNFMDKNPNK